MGLGGLKADRNRLDETDGSGQSVSDRAMRRAPHRIYVLPE
jgi:hypothetical protein